MELASLTCCSHVCVCVALFAAPANESASRAALRRAWRLAAVGGDALESCPAVAAATHAQPSNRALSGGERRRRMSGAPAPRARPVDLLESALIQVCGSCWAARSGGLAGWLAHERDPPESRPDNCRPVCHELGRVGGCWRPAAAESARVSSVRQNEVPKREAPQAAAAASWARTVAGFTLGSTRFASRRSAAPEKGACWERDSRRRRQQQQQQTGSPPAARSRLTCARDSRATRTRTRIATTTPRAAPAGWTKVSPKVWRVCLAGPPRTLSINLHNSPNNRWLAARQQQPPRSPFIERRRTWWRSSLTRASRTRPDAECLWRPDDVARF